MEIQMRAGSKLVGASEESQRLWNELRVAESSELAEARVRQRCEAAARMCREEAEEARHSLRSFQALLQTGAGNPAVARMEAEAARMAAAVREEQLGSELAEVREETGAARSELATLRAERAAEQAGRRSKATQVVWDREKCRHLAVDLLSAQAQSLDTPVEPPWLCYLQQREVMDVLAALLAVPTDPERPMGSDELQSLLTAEGVGEAWPGWARTICDLEDEIETRQRAVAEWNQRLQALQRLGRVVRTGGDMRCFAELSELYQELSEQRTEFFKLGKRQTHVEEDVDDFEGFPLPPHASLEKLQEVAASLTRELRHLRSEQRRQHGLAAMSLAMEARSLRKALAAQEGARERILSEVAEAESAGRPAAVSPLPGGSAVKGGFAPPARGVGLLRSSSLPGGSVTSSPVPSRLIGACGSEGARRHLFSTPQRPLYNAAAASPLRSSPRKGPLGPSASACNFASPPYAMVNAVRSPPKG
eukprot:TRINITY_DN65222_c0_g1_i1.p1 TRINITY_DN65222_c0_g1~~TRINITY_DN65222_c0_g1_i1.p1  ORF type:complete len:478 (-),score=123.83 TRINITY_DN65222_c0_g1_i1:280-1713(-)